MTKTVLLKNTRKREAKKSLFSSVVAFLDDKK